MEPDNLLSCIYKTVTANASQRISTVLGSHINFRVQGNISLPQYFLLPPFTIPTGVEKQGLEKLVYD